MEFNISPYYDDFEQNAKDNNYLKILFQPSRSVQARELNQIQSILQNQIKAFGDHVFQDGSPVIGGNLTYDKNVTYIKLEETFANEDIETETFVNQTIVKDSGDDVQAKVLAAFFPAGGVPTLMIRYLTAAIFADGDTIKIAGTTTRATLVASGASGKGTTVSINEGIFYVDGYFVAVSPQTTVASAYTQTANVKIGLEISDDILDYTIDSTLLDPAQGSFNYQAPGADRYQFNLTLNSRPLETSVDESKFFELMRIENGNITKQVEYPIYSEIEKTLARRTFDESGNYTVDAFVATVAEASNANSYVITLDPGKAYVKGFEFSTFGETRFEVEKPRTIGIDTRSIIEIDVDVSYGNYIKFRNFRGNSAINIGAFETVDLHCVPVNSVNIGIGNAANSAFYGNTKIGTAKIRDVVRDGYSIDTNDTTFDGNGVYRMYLTDVDIKPKVIRMNVASGLSSNTVNLTQYASETVNAFQNVTITILPVLLTPIANVNTANVFIGSTVVNANSAVSNTFATPNIAVGDIIRVGDDTRAVISIDTASNNSLVVNTPFTQTYSGGARLEILKQTDYTSNVTNQTRTITRYASNGVAFLDRPFTDNAVPAANSVVQLNFGIKDLESFVEGNVSTPRANAWANVSSESKYINGDVYISEPSDRVQIYRLPREYVKYNSLDNIDHEYTKYVDDATGASGVFTISLDSYESISWADSDNAIEDNLIAVVRDSTNPSTYANGSILKLTAANVAITSGLAGSVQITTDSAVQKLDVYLTVKANDIEDRKRTKTLRSNPNYTLSPTYTYPKSTDVTIEHTVTVRGNTAAKINVANGLIFITDPTQTIVGPGDSISLYVPDMIKIRKILTGNSAAEVDANNYVDVTNHFNVDFGHRDEIYDHAKLILKQGYPAPNAYMLIHADFFTHTYPAGASYFSVDSYPESMYNNGEIPIYNSSSFGQFVLRDCLDFRPTRQIGLADGTIQKPITPNPDSTTELSFDYYLPRIDKLVLTKEREFKLVKGISDIDPAVPADLPDAMTLYTIYLPPFVPKTNEIRLVYQDHKRYTMKDIASLEKRIESIEYYTALSAIESMAMNDSTQYEDGTEKEKYGIIGEGFKDYDIADYRNPDFTAEIIHERLQVGGNHTNNLLKVLSLTNVRSADKNIVLNYTETPAIVQNVATIPATTTTPGVPVTPVLFGKYEGSIRLNPGSDPRYASWWLQSSLLLNDLRIRGVPLPVVYNELFSEYVRENNQIPVTIPTPTSNALSVISLTPGSNPPAALAADLLPLSSPNTAISLVSGTTSANLGTSAPSINPTTVYPITTAWLQEQYTLQELQTQATSQRSSITYRYDK